MNKIILVTLVFLLTACDSSKEEVVSQRPVEQKPAEQKPVTGRVLQYGLYTLVSGGKVINDTKTSTGKGVSKSVITRDRTVERIPLVRSKYMAYQYRLSDFPVKGRVKLRRVLTHPPFALPDGTISNGSDFTISKRISRGEVFAYDAYALNEDYEMVEGDWVFQIWYKDKKLVEKKFTTYTPGSEEMARLTAPNWLDKKKMEEVEQSENIKTGSKVDI